MIQDFLETTDRDRDHRSLRSPHRFEWPSWELGDVFGWVLDRDPALFGRIFSEEDWRGATYRALIRPSHEREGRAPMVLLHALQRGALVATGRNGKKVARHRWMLMGGTDLPALGRAYVFDRNDVLQLWPDSKHATATSDTTGAALTRATGCRRDRLPRSYRTGRQ